MKAKYIIPYVIGGIGLLLNIGQSNSGVAKEQRQPSTVPPTNIEALMLDSAIMSMADVVFEPKPIDAISMRRDVLYLLDNGDTIRRSGGTRAWRNCNPGNLRYAPFSKSMGAIGECGNFAVFPDEQTGRNALANLLKGNSYKNLSISKAVAKYAPPFQNDVDLYNYKLKKMTGLPLDLKLRDLNQNQLDKVVDAICVIEGWKAGDIAHMQNKKNIQSKQEPVFSDVKNMHDLLNPANAMWRNRIK